MTIGAIAQSRGLGRLSRVIVAGSGIAVVISGCESLHSARSPFMVTTTATATVTALPGDMPPRSTDVANSPYEWGGGADGTGVFSVGAEPRDGMTTAIPPGRYLVKLAPGAKSGSWMLCDTALCGPAFQENATVVGHPRGDGSSAVYVGPRSRTLWLDNVILSTDDPAA